MAWALYARVSTEEQATEGLSIESQLRALHEWAQRKGVSVLEFVDAGKSAWTDNLAKRPQFKAMLDAAIEKRIEGVAVTHIDRFARKMLVQANSLDALAKAGCQFVTLENPNLDLAQPTDKAQAGMLGVWAEMYSHMQSLRIKRGLKERAARGLHTGTLEFGYCNGRCVDCRGTNCERWGTIARGEPAILHPHDAEGVKLAFETYRRGVFSDSDIARLLNDSGYRSRTPRGRVLWSKHSVAVLLTNKSYTGVQEFRGQVVPGKQPAIITQALFDAVQAVRRRRFTRPRLDAPKFRVYLFNGILVCVGCGRKMRAQAYGQKTIIRVYRCTAHESQKVECPKTPAAVPAELLEHQFGAIVEQFRLPPDWQARIQALLADQGPRHDAEAERRRLNERWARVKFMFEQGDKSKEEYLREKEAYKNALAALGAPAEQEWLDAGKYLQNMAQVWAAATEAEQREMVRAILEEAACDPDTRRLVSLRPKPAFTLLFQQVQGLTQEGATFRVDIPTEED